MNDVVAFVKKFKSYELRYKSNSSRSQTRRRGIITHTHTHTGLYARTTAGRASPGLLEPILVHKENERSALFSCATVTVRDPQLLVVTVYNSEVRICVSVCVWLWVWV